HQRVVHLLVRDLREELRLGVRVLRGRVARRRPAQRLRIERQRRDEGRGEQRAKRPSYHRQFPSPNSLATSGTTAASPRPWYAVRQSGLRAFSIAASSFDFFGGTGGIGNASIALCPEPSRAISAARSR